MLLYKIYDIIIIYYWLRFSNYVSCLQKNIYWIYNGYYNGNIYIYMIPYVFNIMYG